MNDRHTTGDNRDEPEWYAIRVKGHLDDHWQDWFDGLRIIPEENGDTLLTCRVVDQAALHGLLRKVRDLGLELLAVNRVAVDRPDQPILNEQTHSEIIRRTNPMTKMKAVVRKEYGSPDVLHIAEVDKPTPKDNELLVRVHANSVNYGDLTGRNFSNIGRGEFHMPSILFYVARLSFGWGKPRQHILGSEFAGEVVAVGPAVGKFQVGDQVYGYLGQDMHGNAEYLTIGEDKAVARKPANMSYEEASVIPYGAIMALNLLKKASIQPGQKVLINGASGAIGSAAVQLAKHYGAEVTGVAGAKRLEVVKELGADHVIDYKQEDFTTSGERYDLVFDILGKSSFRKVKRVLTENGRYLLASFKMKEVFQMLRTSLFGKKKVTVTLATEQPGDLDYIRELVEAGEFTTDVDRVFPMEDASGAHRYIESGKREGPVAIRFATAPASTDGARATERTHA